MSLFPLNVTLRLSPSLVPLGGEQYHSSTRLKGTINQSFKFFFSIYNLIKIQLIHLKGLWRSHKVISIFKSTFWQKKYLTMIILKGFVRFIFNTTLTLSCSILNWQDAIGYSVGHSANPDSESWINKLLLLIHLNMDWLKALQNN